MRIPAHFARGSLLLVLGCGPDAGVVEPGTRAGSGESSFASGVNPAWPRPTPVEGVNSASTDHQPALSKDGLSLYFASNRSGGVGLLDLWFARRACTDGCPWTSPQPVPNVNTKFADIAPGLSRDGHQLFFASQRSNGHCSVTPPTTPQSPQCDRDLWVSYREDVHDDLGWGEAVNLAGPINSTGEEIAPSYFENDEVGIPQLFFNRGAIGGDIYVSEMVNGVWTEPSAVTALNMPDPVTDQRPSISHDGLEIYFYSDRDGTQHLWVATRESASSSWSTPIPVEFANDVDAPAIMPFIHSHGRTETLLFVRPFALGNRDLWISERKRPGRPE